MSSKSQQVELTSTLEEMYIIEVIKDAKVEQSLATKFKDFSIHFIQFASLVV